MARLHKPYGGAITIDVDNGVIDIPEFDFTVASVPITLDTGDLDKLHDVTSSAAELNILDGATTTFAEVNYNDITTLGTGAASKAVVLDTGEDYTWPATGVLTYGVLKDPAGTTLGATAAELNIAADASAQTEIIDAAGVVSATKRITRIAGTGAGSVTLAAPDATMLGLVKLIEMTAASGAITLALTNCDGGSAATTASFDASGETLMLVGGVSKWHIFKEIGVTLS